MKLITVKMKLFIETKLSKIRINAYKLNSKLYILFIGVFGHLMVFNMINIFIFN